MMLTDEQIAVAEQQMESAYRQGDLGAAAIAAWIVSAHDPSRGSWKIYAKKILRETNAESVPAKTILSAVTAAMSEGRHLEAFATLCLGLLDSPADSSLLARIIELGKQFGREDLVDGALSLLPSDVSDFGLLNIKAARAHEAGRYAESEAAFRQLLLLRPDSIDLQLNLSAALVGLERWDDAVSLLENLLLVSKDKREALFRLIPVYRKRTKPTEQSLLDLRAKLGEQTDSAEKSHIEALIYSYLDRPEESAEAYQRSLAFYEDSQVRFDLSLVQLRIGDYEHGFTNYRERFSCFEANRWLEPKCPRYAGQKLDTESLLVWAEQGIGDEVFFGYALEGLRDRVKHVVLAVDPRLKSFFALRFPQWQVLTREEIQQRVSASSTAFDFEIPMGELMPLFFSELRSYSKTRLHPLFKADTDRIDAVREIVQNNKQKSHKPVVAISWRGGTEMDGKARSMTLPELMAGLPPTADVDVISVQYSGNVGDEIQQLGDPRVRSSGLDNRNDLAGILTLLSEVDAVVSVDNAVVHFAAAVGTPVEVIIPQALSQYRFKNDDFRDTFFPEAHLHVNGLEGGWSEAVEDAWQSVLSRLKNHDSEL